MFESRKNGYQTWGVNFRKIDVSVSLCTSLYPSRFSLSFFPQSRLLCIFPLTIGQGWSSVTAEPGSDDIVVSQASSRLRKGSLGPAAPVDHSAAVARLSRQNSSPNTNNGSSSPHFGVFESAAAAGGRGPCSLWEILHKESGRHSWFRLILWVDEKSLAGQLASDLMDFQDYL